jgi:hypothetical protein
MAYFFNTSDINQTFIIEPLSITGGSPTLTACTGLYTNAVVSCDGNTQILMGTGLITFDGNLYTNDDFTANVVSGTTFYGDGSNLTGISTGETYTNSASTPNVIGGIASGSSFNNKTMTEMWNLLLYPYQTPSFSNFGRTNISTEYDLGQPVLAGSQTFSWVTANSSNILPNTLKIDQLYPSIVNLISGSTNDGSEIINLTGSTILLSGAGTISMYKITATNSNSVDFTLTISRTWKNRWYYGKDVSTTLTTLQITGLSNTNLVTTVTNTGISFTASSSPEYLYVIIPQGLGQPSDWRDSTTGCFGNNIPYSNVGTATIVNTYGISTIYNIYRSTNQITGSQNVWLCS